MQIATVSFTDPTDGTWIEAGRTLVSENSDVYRLHPERFKAAPSLSSGQLARHQLTAPVKRRPTRTSQRPSWMLGQNEPWRLRY